MGTAPQSRQADAMPDPERTVSRSVGLLRRLGLSKTDALFMVVSVARTARDCWPGHEPAGMPWLSQVISTAQVRLAHSLLSSIDEVGDDNADRAGSRAGGPATGAERGPEN